MLPAGSGWLSTATTRSPNNIGGQNHEGKWRTGSFARDNLGVITPHEHIFINLSNFFVNHPVRGIEDPTTAPVKMEYLCELNRDPYALLDNLIMDDYDTQLKEILRFKAAGGHTMVDATMPGIGEIGISEVFNEEERRVLKASAIAHKKTGVGILVHSTPGPPMAQD